MEFAKPRSACTPAQGRRECWPHARAIVLALNHLHLGDGAYGSLRQSVASAEVVVRVAKDYSPRRVVGHSPVSRQRRLAEVHRRISEPGPGRLKPGYVALH